MPRIQGYVEKTIDRNGVTIKVGAGQIRELHADPDVLATEQDALLEHLEETVDAYLSGGRPRRPRRSSPSQTPLCSAPKTVEPQFPGLNRSEQQNDFSRVFEKLAATNPQAADLLSRLTRKNAEPEPQPPPDRQSLEHELHQQGESIHSSRPDLEAIEAELAKGDGAPLKKKRSKRRRQR